MEDNESKAEAIIEQPHSVEFSMNAKGQMSGKVKCYGSTPEEAFERACNLLNSIEIMIEDKNKLNGN